MVQIDFHPEVLIVTDVLIQIWLGNDINRITTVSIILYRDKRWLILFIFFGHTIRDFSTHPSSVNFIIFWDYVLKKNLIVVAKVSVGDYWRLLIILPEHASLNTRYIIWVPGKELGCLTLVFEAHF